MKSELVIHKALGDFVNLRSLPLMAAALKRGQAPRSTNCSNAVGTALEGEPALPKRI